MDAPTQLRHRLPLSRPGFAHVHLVVALVPLAAVVNIALFDDIVRVDASTWLVANYIMCGIDDGA